jgi:glycerol-3-phosphate acyltransferase PlsX
MRILLDVMGGDLPPEELIKGGIAAGRQEKVDILFSGQPQLIRTVLMRNGQRESERFSILPSSQVITMDDPPVRAVRGKRDASLVRGLMALKAHDVDAFVSPGNTGAAVVGSILTLGRIPGISRPGILTSLPTLPGPEILVIDVGANTDCTPIHLEHFAFMGASYAQYVLGIQSPKVGLLNIGTEKTKGNKLNAHTFKQLEKSGSLSFAGNVEGHHLLTERPVDVVVCDGFLGNVLLKALEGGVSVVTEQLKQLISNSRRAKLGAWFLRPVFAALRERISYQRRGGAPLLGVNGVVVIAHGRSNAEAIQSAVSVACRTVEANVNERIRQEAAGRETDGS